jgi:hypothetical protein
VESILKATGINSDQAGLPAHQIHSLRQMVRVNPFWRQEARPIFDHNASGPYADPFPILTGANTQIAVNRKGPSEQDIEAYRHRRRVA